MRQKEKQLVITARSPLKAALGMVPSSSSDAWSSVMTLAT